MSARWVHGAACGMVSLRAYKEIHYGEQLNT